MGLFKDFKEDFSQAVNEMIPGGETLEKENNVDNLVVDTIGDDVDVKSELSKLDGLLEQVKDKPVEKKAEAPQKPVAQPVQPAPVQPVPEVKKETIVKEENNRMSDQMMKTMNDALVQADAVVDETSVITASTVLSGDIQTTGSFDIQGTINGNVACNGKLVVTGTINGNSHSSEFFADVAKIEGEVVSTGTVKVGAGSVIIGNISAASAVIAGAVKGDIDVQGPVVIDTSAVIMGNIKSRSVQINNGAVIEGFCSQCYAEVYVQGLFGAN